MNTRSNNVVPLRPEAEASNRTSRDLVAEWFELHRKDLLRYARRVLPASESPEDLVHNVFYRILKQDDLAALRNPRAFLMTATRNVSRGWIPARSRRHWAYRRVWYRYI